MKLSSSTAAPFLLGNILLNKLWESFIWVALVVLAFNNAFAQNGRWYNLESEPKKSKISFTYSSKSIPANEQKLIKFVPKGLDNIRISSISLSIELNVFNLLSKGVLDTIEFNKRKIPKGSYSRNDHRWRLFGIRAKKSGKEVLIIDSDFDHRFDDEIVFFLPEVDQNKSFALNLEYDYLYNHMVYPMEIALSVMVKRSFEDKLNKWKYRDDFHIGFKNNLFYEGIFEKEEVRIELEESYPYIHKTVHIKVLTKKYFDYTLNIGDPFQLSSSGFFFSIDSVDYINKRILVNKTSSSTKFINISSSSLFSDDTLSIEPNRALDYRLVHVWGSWCNPCMSNLPKIKRLSSSFPKLELIGVCVDYDKKKALNAAEKNNISWKNLFFDIHKFESEGIMNVFYYPTYFILDNKNAVLAKFDNIDQVEMKLTELYQ